MATIQDELEDTMQVVRSLQAYSDPLKALKEILTRELELVEYLGGLSEALNARPPRVLVEDLRSEWEEFRKSEPFEELLRRAVEQGVLRRDLDVPVCAAMLSGLVLKRNWRPLLAERTPAELAEAAVQLFLRAAGPEARAGMSASGPVSGEGTSL